MRPQLAQCAKVAQHLNPLANAHRERFYQPLQRKLLTRVYHWVMATAVKRLDLAIGELVEVGGRRYEVVPDREGGLTLEPPITPMSELDEKWGTAPASVEDFERLTAEDSTDGEG